MQIDPFEKCLYGIETCLPTYESFEEDVEKEQHPEEQDTTTTNTSSSSAFLSSSLEQPEHTVSLKELRHLVLSQEQGLTHYEDAHRRQGGRGNLHRGVVWRLLWGYLPAQVHMWKATLQRQRQHYLDCVQEAFQIQSLTDLLHKGHELSTTTAAAAAADHEGGDFSSQSTESANGSSTPPLALEDFHLSPQLQQMWLQDGRDLHALKSLVTHKYNRLKLLSALDNDDTKCCIETIHDNLRLLDEIRKDVTRTQTGLAFFLGPTQDVGARRYAAMERILFTWAQHNPDSNRKQQQSSSSSQLTYVQGMNEIVAVLYFVLANDPNPEWSVHAEADTYGLLVLLLHEFRDVYCPALDTATRGLHGRSKTLEQLLARHDPSLWRHFQNIALTDLSFFAVRWWTALLSREFLLPDVIQLWDHLFAYHHCQQPTAIQNGDDDSASKKQSSLQRCDIFLRYFCLTMILCIREELLLEDFGGALVLLQQYQTTSMDMDQLLASARALWVYEAKIMTTCQKAQISLSSAIEAIPLSEQPDIVMAFGLRGGGHLGGRSTSSATTSGFPSAASVRVATQKLSTQAQGWMNRFKSEVLWGRKQEDEKTSDDDETKDSIENRSITATSSDLEVDERYMEAVLGALSEDDEEDAVVESTTTLDDLDNLLDSVRAIQEARRSK